MCDDKWKEKGKEERGKGKGERTERPIGCDQSEGTDDARGNTHHVHSALLVRNV
jgi:hypothetical protein